MNNNRAPNGQHIKDNVHPRAQLKLKDVLD